MNPHDQAWQKLAAAARRAPAAGDDSAPFGFSTRVAALAFDLTRQAPSDFGRLSLRAAGIACLFAVVAVGYNYTAIANAFDDEPAVAAGDDPAAEVANLDS
jgi:hypothetical protein